MWPEAGDVQRRLHLQLGDVRDTSVLAVGAQSIKATGRVMWIAGDLDTFCLSNISPPGKG